MLVTVNTAYRAAELEYLLRQGDITSIFMVEELRDNTYLESVYSIVPELKLVLDPIREAVHSAALPCLKRVILFGEGSPVPVVLMEQIKAKMGADLIIAFGMTEASGYISHTLSTDTYELKSSTVGIPLPYADVKLVNPRTGEPVGIGERGELLTRGFLVMKGYYNMPEKTAEAIDTEGWLYPAEIEAFLMRHPKVAEAQVIGVPDPFMGEELVALLKLKPGEQANEEEIRDYCRGSISKHKIPRYIRFVTAYPLTASGKVKKFELRAQFMEELEREAE